MATKTATARKTTPRKSAAQAAKGSVPAPVSTRQQTKVMIDGHEVIYENLTPDQQRLFQIVLDVDQKIAKKQLDLEELALAKDLAMARLNGSLGRNPQGAQ